MSETVADPGPGVTACTTGTTPAQPRPRILLAAVALLVVATLTAFWPVVHNGFVSFDDDTYITANPHVRHGVSWEGIAWALTAHRAAAWHPLTWLSHMVDCQLFGLRAGPHHLHSLLLHAAAAGLALVVLVRMTGRLLPSVLVAAAFALHPLRVESVAWAAERKDVLGALLWMSTTWLYVRWTRDRRAARQLAMLVSYGLGLLSKPTLVALPLALLLLDYWPLGRLRAGSVFARIREKAGLLLMALLAAAATVAAGRLGGAVVALESLSWSARLANAVVAYVAYLGKTVFPVDLAVLYPLPLQPRPFVQVAGAALLLAGITALALRVRRRAPGVPVGWLWFVGTLVPAIGVVQVGSHAMADRFTYLPHLGLLVALVWGADAMVRAPRLRRALAVGALVLVVAMGWQTRRQVALWQTSTKLYTHALAVTRDNYAMHTDLGVELGRSGQVEAAVRHFDEALRLKPDYAPAWNNRGMAYAAQGRIGAAMEQYRQSLRLDGRNARAHFNLGVAYASQGQWELAIPRFVEAVELQPDYANAHNNLGIALAARGQYAAARAEFERVLALEPGHGDARRNLHLLRLRLAEDGLP